jgi:hypothetical protein
MVLNKKDIITVNTKSMFSPLEKNYFKNKPKDNKDIKDIKEQENKILSKKHSKDINKINTIQIDNINCNNTINKQNNNLIQEKLLLEMKEYKFLNLFNIWVHTIDSKDWTKTSYKVVYKIKSLYDFWEFFTNIHLYNQWKYNFFIMKENSFPSWEDETNRNGGTCSIRIDINKSIELIEQLCILLVNETLINDSNDINGISFYAKNNWCIIKIWNKNNKNNISQQLPQYLRKMYPSITIQYKVNTPEY